MTIEDQVVAALTCWRENRGGRPQPDAMQSVMNVIQNRAAKTSDSSYTVCTQHAQFSSISMPGPEADLWPVEADSYWHIALSLAEQAAAGTLDDITAGATNYYAVTMKTPPYWADEMVPTVTIAGQRFFK
jgi:N-acetylmuramoyl-L-alanine amidase